MKQIYWRDDSPVYSVLYAIGRYQGDILEKGGGASSNRLQPPVSVRALYYNTSQILGGQLLTVHTNPGRYPWHVQLFPASEKMCKCTIAIADYFYCNFSKASVNASEHWNILHL